MSRELPTEPEMVVTSAARAAALKLWAEHHSLTDELRSLLASIVAGYQGAALRARLGIGKVELAQLEDLFHDTFSQTVYLVAADVIETAYQSGLTDADSRR